MDWKELLAKAESALKDLEKLQAEGKADEAKAKSAELDALQTKIDEAKAVAARRKAIASARAEFSVVEPNVNMGAGADSVPAAPIDHISDESVKTVRFLEWCKTGQISDEARRALQPVSESFKTHNGVDTVGMPKYVFYKMMGKPSATKALPTGFGVPTVTVPTGQIQTIPPDFRALLLELPPEPTYILPRCTVVPAPYGSVLWPHLRQTDPQNSGNEFGGVSGSWITEGAEKSDEELTIDQLNIRTYEYAGYTELTNRLLSRSAIELEPLLTRLFRGNMMDALDRAFLTGNGVGRPLGICQLDPVPPAWNPGGLQARLVSRNVANRVSYIDLINLEHAVEPYHRRPAIWVEQDTVYRDLRTQVDTNNRPIWIPYTMSPIADAPDGSIFGKPHIPTIRCPALGSRGDIIYGDWSQYIVAMELEAVVQRSEHYKFKNNVTAFRATIVVGGKNSQPRAFSILDDAVASTTSGAQTSTTTTTS